MKSVLKGYWGLLKGEKVHLMGTLIITECLWDSFVRLKHPLQYCQYIPHLYVCPCRRLYSCSIIYLV